MPVPTSIDPLPRSGPPASHQPSQKLMTKAERRELQERQRASKLAQKSAPGGGASSTLVGAPATSITSKQKPPSTPSQKKFSGDVNGAGPRSAVPKDTNASASVAVDDGTSGRSVSRGLRIFSHFGLTKAVGHSIKGDIHPAIIRLGLLFSEFRICGANARCIATLTAFKNVIQDYTTPPHNTLSRHLMTHLSPQITHLVAARPMSVTMGNAIRQLKLEISGSDIDMIEQDAKDALCQKIDNYIRDRIIIADEVIQELAGKKINDGDVILTYARSSVVEKIILNAHEEGKRFSVIVVDSRPLLEGKALLKKLTNADPPIHCTYALLPAVPSLITEVTTVLLGAHSISSNGSVYSRAGTALVAMMAKGHSVPVMVCCETYKFSEGVMLDGFGKNELAPARFSKVPKNSQELTPTPFLEILNPLYDLTPSTCITAVVTEVGLIPPSSISSIPLALGKTTL
ncbi:putative translation initiation factor eIF-2B subunit delta [Hypsizygus marmoreus]|uniref:Translation initiation factor eIF2B subunit delta n=1 Tax=Hypsizygus marmoreus TaxID=39966 RepID=A0A369JN35_HYPMA|nr:putative translation initiation factor eIF-2B subunit delta [Hypsizygus marmoreus]